MLKCYTYTHEISDLCLESGRIRQLAKLTISLVLLSVSCSESVGLYWPIIMQPNSGCSPETEVIYATSGTFGVYIIATCVCTHYPCVNKQFIVFPEEKKCTPCRQPVTMESVVDNFCNSEFGEDIILVVSIRL